MSDLGHSVAVLVAGADSSSAAVEAVIRMICETERWDCGRYFRPPSEGAALRLEDAWGIADASIQAFLQRSKDLEYRPGDGLIGAVWNSGQPLWVTELSKEHGALRRAYTPDLAAGGAFVFPVKSQGAVVGVLSFNSRERRAPDERLLQSILDIGAQIGQFLQRKHAEEQLRRSEARLVDAQRTTQQLIEALPNPIFFKDTDGRYLGVNRAWEAFFGTRRDAFVGKTVHDLYPDNPEIADRLRADDQMLWDEPGTPHVHEESITTPDGKRHEAIYYKATLTRADGAVAGLIGTIIDITERKKVEEDLRRFRAAIDVSGDAILLIDRASMCYIDVNQTFCDLVGYTRQELIGMTPMDLFSADRETLERDYDALIEASNRGATKIEGYYRCKDGTLLPIESHRRALRTKDGWTIVGSARDITERKQAEQALREGEKRLRASNQQLQMLIESSPLAVYTRDANGLLTSWNPAAEKMFGWTAAEVLGKPLPSVPQEARAQSDALRARLLAGEAFIQYEARRTTRDGSPIDIDAFLGPLRDGAGKITGIIAVVANITDRKRAEERIRHMADHDSLTGLPNRLLFNDRLSQAVSFARRESSQFALLYLDLDKFKPVNDTFGHDAGDQLLKKVAGRIREQVRESDTVARVGGDEFTVILRDTSSLQDVSAVARKIIAALATPFDLANPPHQVEIGTSIGIAVYPTDAQDHETLVKKADAAMYCAKAQRNCFRFSAAQVRRFRPGTGPRP